MEIDIEISLIWFMAYKMREEERDREIVLGEKDNEIQKHCVCVREIDLDKSG